MRSPNSSKRSAPEQLRKLKRSQRLLCDLATRGGMSTDEIAAMLDVEPRVADDLLRQSMKTAGVSSRQELRALIENGAVFDIFISHASEDKKSLVRPLALELSRLGLRVWFDEMELEVGDSLSESISRGMAQSAFGILVLSPSFFKKKWTAHELRGLNALAIDEQVHLLPIWHRVTKKQVIAFSPPLADLIAIDSSKRGSRETALAVLKKVSPSLYRQHGGRVASAPGDTKEVATGDIKFGPRRRKRLSPHERSRLQLICEVLSTAVSMPKDKTEVSFCYDRHPDAELMIWEAIATAYLSAGGAEMSKSQAKHLYGVLLSLTCGSRETNYEYYIKDPALFRKAMQAMSSAMKWPQSTG